MVMIANSMKDIQRLSFFLPGNYLQIA